jgi:iron complex transport system permease protein
MADPSDQLAAITFWLLGSLASATPADLGPMPLVLLRWRINLLSLGDDESRSLDVDAPRLRSLVLAAATPITASVAAIAGVVGRVIPHLARMLVGAGYLLLADTRCRALATIEIPLGNGPGARIAHVRATARPGPNAPARAAPFRCAHRSGPTRSGCPRCG